MQGLKKQKINLNRVALIGVLILLYLLFSAGSGRWLGKSDIMNTLNNVYFMGFLTLGVTFVIATGGIDFSIGPVMYCCALVSGQLLVVHGWPLWLCLLICILTFICYKIIYNMTDDEMRKVSATVKAMADEKEAKALEQMEQ